MTAGRGHAGRPLGSVPGGVPSVDLRSSTAKGSLGFPRPDRESVVFAALADSTRREVLAVLAERGESTATELADMFPVTRQMVSKHLSVLAAAGLVIGRRVGKEQRYALQPLGLEVAARWVATVGSEWDRRLERLRNQLST